MKCNQTSFKTLSVWCDNFRFMCFWLNSVTQFVADSFRTELFSQVFPIFCSCVSEQCNLMQQDHHSRWINTCDTASATAPNSTFHNRWISSGGTADYRVPEEWHCGAIWAEHLPSLFIQALKIRKSNYSFDLYLFQHSKSTADCTVCSCCDLCELLVWGDCFVLEKELMGRWCKGLNKILYLCLLLGNLWHNNVVTT